MHMYLVWCGDEVEPYMERIFSDEELAIWWARETWITEGKPDFYWVTCYLVDSDPMVSETVWKSTDEE